MASWSSLAAPKGTPDEIVEKWSKVMTETMAEPAIVKFYEDSGSTVLQGATKQKAREFYESEGAKFKLIIEKSGATADKNLAHFNGSPALAGLFILQASAAFSWSRTFCRPVLWRRPLRTSMIDSWSGGTAARTGAGWGDGRSRAAESRFSGNPAS
jgi:hypothetical protein